MPKCAAGTLSVFCILSLPNGTLPDLTPELTQ